MGKALRDGYRDRAFLMTKIEARSRRIAAGQIDECLRRLRVDTIDLLQFHEIIRQEDPDWIFGPDGAIEAVIAARQAGKIRYVGFTGHKDPVHHLKMLRVAAEHDFRFDAVQMPLNVLDHHYEGHSFERQVVPVLVEQGIGVLGMKPLAGGRIPATGAVSAVEGLRYALSLPTSVVITGCDSLAVLEQALEVARTFQPLSQEEVESIVNRTASLGARGEYEPFKTTQNHDGTTQHPEWMWERTA
jgi:predicted aldo/keto reductase-like oxidoreductase